MSEKDFEDCLLLQTVRYIRAHTARINTRYYVYGCVGDELFEQAIQLCQRRQRHFQAGEKGVVYCCRRSTTEEMALALHCGFFHAGGTDNEATVQRRLEHGGFIVAISALGTGVDYAGIVFVLHVDLPYGMIDFAQESGRAGRGGESVDSVILLGEHWLQDDRHLSGTSGSIDEAVMQDFVRTRHCRRAVLGRYFDGTTVCCDDGDWARCDRCGEGQMDWQEGQRVRAITREKIEQTLNEMVDGCPMCWIHTAIMKVDRAERSRGCHDTPGMVHELDTEEQEERNTGEEEDPS